jgi:hypothetical protein
VDGWTWKSNKQYITHPYRSPALSSFQAVNNTLHQRLAARFPIEDIDSFEETSVEDL